MRLNILSHFISESAMRVLVSRSHGTDTGLSPLLIFAIQTVTLPSAALPVPSHRWQDL